MRGLLGGASFWLGQVTWCPGLGLKLGFRSGPVLDLTFREGGGGVLYDGPLGKGPIHRGVALHEWRPFLALSGQLSAVSTVEEVPNRSFASGRAASRTVAVILAEGHCA